MTILNTQVVVGVDVAKAEIVIYRSDLKQIDIVANERSALKKWLKKLPRHSAIGLEATGIYHVEMTELAHGMGHDVYIIDGSRVNKYRDSLGIRAKTDASDAQLLARYLANESDSLRIWSPPPEAYTQLKSLLLRRAQLIKWRVAMKQSWKAECGIDAAFDGFLAAVDDFEKEIRKTLKALTEGAGLQEQVKRCQAVEGVGVLTGTAMATAFIRGDFVNSDAFVAFLGLDLRVRQSGQRDQQRRLSKRGDPEWRRLLHNSSMAASRSETWKPFYESYLARGFKATQALVILARKLARVMFSLMKNKTDYSPNTWSGGCPRT